MTDKDLLALRWRLIFGKDAEAATADAFPLTAEEIRIDNALSALYQAERQGGLGKSQPNVAAWLQDIRTFFPQSMVHILQKDALERLNLKKLLLEPELLEQVVPDVHLAATLIGLKNLVPEKAKSAARQVIEKLVQDLMARLRSPTEQAITGSLKRQSRTFRPRFSDIDWPRTIRRNLKNYQADYQTIIPEVHLGFSRRRRGLKEVFLCVDQSGSMAASVIYAGIFSAVLASLPALTTRLVVFDTEVVDLTENLQDPVELLFGLQLGGGTDIGKALTYCQGLITRPNETTFILISDLYEGGRSDTMRARAVDFVRAGALVIVLLALNDDGSPAFDQREAAFFASLGVAVFACTPDLFPELMAKALAREDIFLWAGEQGIKLAG
jgi:uncharacterized protein with von Willebrand factor type A (vWA) domain